MSNLTDAKIIKAFEICESTTLGCVDCPYYSQKVSGKCLPNLMRDVLDLINRKDAKIESLKASIKEADEHFSKGNFAKGIALIIRLVKEMECSE